MSSIIRFAKVLLLLSVAMCGLTLIAPVSHAEDAKTPPATQPGINKLYIAQMEELRAVWMRAAESLGEPEGNVPATLADATKREADAPRAIPIIKEELKLYDKIAPTKTMPDVTIAEMRLKAQAMLLLLNDADTKARVDRLRSSEVADEKFEAVSTDLLSRFLEVGTDAVAQAKLVDQAEKLDRENPAQPQLAILTYALFRVNYSDELEDRLRRLLADPLTSPAAGEAKAIIDAEMKRWADIQKMSDEARAKRKELVGKPITIIGKTPDGKDFTSADLKGKVVMVDFWATWCGPCIGGMPEVKEQYKKYRDQGFEIIGVSSDWDAKKLTDFVAKNDMPWVQLFDPTNEQGKGAELPRQYNVVGIPTMFLIDKKGILRTVDARTNMKEMIPKLLAEPRS